MDLYVVTLGFSAEPKVPSPQLKTLLLGLRGIEIVSDASDYCATIRASRDGIVSLKAAAPTASISEFKPVELL